jgi:hypothetical protein
MVQHLEQMRLAKQKMKKNKRSDKSKRSTTRKRPLSSVKFSYLIAFLINFYFL